MDWIKILETQNICTLCAKYDNCTAKPAPNYDCWVEKEETMDIIRACADCTFCQVSHEQDGELLYSCSAPGWQGVGKPIVGTKEDISLPLVCWFEDMKGGNHNGVTDR